MSLKIIHTLKNTTLYLGSPQSFQMVTHNYTWTIPFLGLRLPATNSLGDTTSRI